MYKGVYEKQAVESLVRFITDDHLIQGYCHAMAARESATSE